MTLINELQISENNIAYDISIGNSYQLNETSKQIIKLLQLGNTKQEILEKLSKEYNISPEDLYIDINDFFSKLKIYNLI